MVHTLLNATTSPPHRPKTITAACLPPKSDSIFVGTLGGTTYPVDVQLYGMSPEIITPTRARSRLGYQGDDDPGPVQCIALNPANKRQVRADLSGMFGCTHMQIHHTCAHTHTQSCMCALFQLLIGHEVNYFELWDAFATKPLKIIKGAEVGVVWVWLEGMGAGGAKPFSAACSLTWLTWHAHFA